MPLSCMALLSSKDECGQVGGPRQSFKAYGFLRARGSLRSARPYRTGRQMIDTLHLLILEEVGIGEICSRHGHGVRSPEQLMTEHQCRDAEHSRCDRRLRRRTQSGLGIVGFDESVEILNSETLMREAQRRLCLRIAPLPPDQIEKSADGVRAPLKRRQHAQEHQRIERVRWREAERNASLALRKYAGAIGLQALRRN